MRTRALLSAVAICAAVPAVVSPAIAQDLLVDTGPGNNTTVGGLSTFDSGSSFQFVGMRVSFAEPTDIGRIDAWISGFGTMEVFLRNNSGSNLPGTVIASSTFNPVFTIGWQSLAGLAWSVPAGTYWITFEPISGNTTFPVGAPTPLSNYSYWSDGNPGWISLGQAWPMGLRVYTPAPPVPVLVPDEFATIQSAIDFVSNGQVIEVAPGTYDEAINFNGKSITVRSAGGPDATIIDATGLNQPVVRVPSGSSSATRLEGFTITGGVHTTSLAEGGGISIEGGQITVEDCIITQNVAESGCGAAIVFSGNATFNFCTFDDNDNLGASVLGGGAYVNGATASFNDCTFANNDVGSSGGALNVNVNGSVNATGCVFMNNTSGNAGGAVTVISSTADADFTDCIFHSNVAVQAGGAMVNAAVADFVSCEFIGNESTHNAIGGGGIQVQGGAVVGVTMCEFVGNQTNHAGGGVQFISFSGTGSIANSSFRNNQAALAGGALHVNGSAPTVSGTEFCGNTPTHTLGTFTDGGGNTFSAACTPDNNDPDDPELILAPGAHAGTFAGATNTGTSSCDPDGVDVFYAFTITNGPTDILIDTCGSNADTALAVFDLNDVEIGCTTSCAGFPCNSTAACLPLPALPDGEYLIRVSLQTGAAAGVALDFVLNFSEVEFAVPGDLNGDQVVDEQDRVLLCAALGSSMRDPEYLDTADFDDNGTIDELDQQAFNAILPPCNGDIVTSANFQPPPDGLINGADLAYLLGAWGMQPSCADMVTSATFQPPPDGRVDGADLAFLLGAWGSCR